MLIRSKRSYLLDGNGNKLKRKVRKDDKGLYVINHGMRGRLKKSVRSFDCDGWHVINIIRQVDYYESA
jgi:hypothetical protein